MPKNCINFNHLVKKYSDSPALMSQTTTLSYYQYFGYINDVSGLLKKEGVHSGSKVVVLSEINFYFPILFFSILVLGGIVVPVNPKFPTMKILSLLADIDCEFIVTFDSGLTPDFEKKFKVLSIESLFKRLVENKRYQIFPSLKFDNFATIIFTSGTRGKPKGVLHTIGNHYYSAAGSNLNIPLNQDDCWMVSLPFYHIAAIAILFRTMIAGAGCFIPDSVQNLSYYIEHHHITHTSLVTTQLHRWIADDNITDSVKSLKAILIGGSYIPQSLIKKALTRELPVFTSYGSTEMSSQITTTSAGDLIKQPVSSGKLLSYRKLKINIKGEIMVKGKTLCYGYVAGKKISGCRDQYGWFHTGDLGLYDRYKNLHVHGRIDNMFISGGENIYPEEIELQLQYQQNIRKVCVVDIPDEEYGARPVAFIKMEDQKVINESGLKKFLGERIESFKIPVKFLDWPEDIGRLKPDRTYLRELAITLVMSSGD